MLPSVIKAGGGGRSVDASAGQVSTPVASSVAPLTSSGIPARASSSGSAGTGVVREDVVD